MKSLFFLTLVLSFGAQAKAPTKPMVNVQVAKLKRVAKSLLFPALVKSRVESNIMADANLIVVRPLVALGQRVKKGDKLLELRNQDTSVTYQNKIIRSQVTGTVASILVDQGQYIKEGQELIKINDPENLYLKVEVPVANYRELKKGLKIKGQGFQGEVSAIGAVLDPISGTVPAELTFKEDQEGLLPGTISNVEIILDEQDKLLVPEKAVYYSGEKTFLPLLRAGKVQKVPVKVGDRAQGEIEILEGVKLEETIIVGAGEFLKDGAEVQVAKE